MTIMNDVSGAPFNIFSMVGIVEIAKPFRGTKSSKTHPYTNATAVYGICNQVLWISTKNLMKSICQSDSPICRTQNGEFAMLSLLAAFGVSYAAAYMTNYIGKVIKNLTIPIQESEYIMGAGAIVNMKSIFEEVIMSSRERVS